MSDSAEASVDTIAAIATAPGRGGVGIVRISGPLAARIAVDILGKQPKVRHAHFGNFYGNQKEGLDQGIALFFQAPHSFTGEDVLELQAHGGPILLDLILKRAIALGARQAKPGEFSERAFLNDKIDLAQAEAVADLIQASSEQAAKQALNSLQGVFSKKIHALVEALIHLRMYVESAIDFPEEEIDFLNDGKIQADLQSLIEQTESILLQAQQGAIIREGMKVAIVGKPNAGKSSLLNALAAKDVAIVTDIAGTTRDVLREHLHIDGMPLHIIDTAGIRQTTDQVEQIGVERAWAAAEEADALLLLIDAADYAAGDSCEDMMSRLAESAELTSKLTIVFNKVDLVSNNASLPKNISSLPSCTVLNISVKQSLGLEALKNHLKSLMGLKTTTEGAFSARRRHVEAIESALSHLKAGQLQLMDYAAGELLAEELTLAQQFLSEITGAFSSDDLLGKIFSSFCIGK